MHLIHVHPTEVHLTEYDLISVYLRNVYPYQRISLTGLSCGRVSHTYVSHHVHLISMHLISVYPISVHLRCVSHIVHLLQAYISCRRGPFTGVHLIDVHPIGCACTSYRDVSRRRTSQACVMEQFNLGF